MRILAHAAVAAIALILCKSAIAAAPAKPNVLLILTDDHRRGAIHALGCDGLITPNLDSLVRRGIAFDRASIMGSNQGAVCVPSRVMLLTGRSLFRTNGKLDDHLLLPQHFRNNGYHTFLAGKWHNERTAVNRAFVDASAVYFGGMGNAKKGSVDGEAVEITVQDYDPAGKYPPARAKATVRDATEVVADAAVRFLDGYKDDKPFFIYIALTSPHDPRIAPKKYRDLYDPANIPLPPNFLPQHPFDNGELKVRDEMLAGFPRKPDEIRRHIADYYACISWLDDNIGRVFEALRKSGRFDNTLIIFAGDNGLALGQHGLMGKQSVYEHSIGVPLVLAGPGIPAGGRSSALCYLMDVFSTISDLSGLPRPAGLESRSLAPVIRGEKASVRDELFHAYRGFQRSVATADIKLIEYYVNRERHTQLFDLRADPWETRNLANAPERAADLARLRQRLDELQRQLDDPRLEPGA